MTPLKSSEIEKVLENHKEKIDIIEDKLEEHDEKIQQYEINFVRTEEKLNSLEKEIKENRNISLQSNTLILNSLQSNTQLLQTVVSEMGKISTALVDLQINKDNKQLEENKDNNKTNLWLKILAIGGTVIGYFIGKNQ